MLLEDVQLSSWLGLELNLKAVLGSAFAAALPTSLTPAQMKEHQGVSASTGTAQHGKDPLNPSFF